MSLTGTELVHHIRMLSNTGDQISDIPQQIWFSGCCASGNAFFPTHTPSAQGKAFCNCLILVQFLGVSASGVRYREAAVLMGPLTSHLICSSSPEAHKFVFFYSVSLGTPSALFVGPVASSLQKSRACFCWHLSGQHAASGVSVPPLALLSV